MLDDFSVDYEQQAFEDASVIRCYDGSRTVYGMVCRKALEAHFRAPDSCAQSCDTFVDRNLGIFAEMVRIKYQAGAVETIELPSESGFEMRRPVVRLDAGDIAALSAELPLHFT
jgi:hypothetical protein